MIFLFHFVLSLRHIFHKIWKHIYNHMISELLESNHKSHTVPAFSLHKCQYVLLWIRSNMHIWRCLIKSYVWHVRSIGIAVFNRSSLRNVRSHHTSTLLHQSSPPFPLSVSRIGTYYIKLCHSSWIIFAKQTPSHWLIDWTSSFCHFWQVQTCNKTVLYT